MAIWTARVEREHVLGDATSRDSVEVTGEDADGVAQLAIVVFGIVKQTGSTLTNEPA